MSETTDQAKTLEDELALARSAVATEPSDTELQRRLVHLLLQSGHPEEAEATAHAAVAAAPDAVACQDILVFALEEMGRSGDELVTALQRAAELDPDNASRHLHLGRVLLQEGRLSDAELALQWATILEPDLAPAHDLLTDALRKQNRWQDAIVPARRTVELMSENIDRKLRLAHTLMRSGALADAEYLLRQAGPIQDRPLAFHRHHLLSITLEWQGRLDEAIEEARRGEELEPENPGLHARLARMLLSAGRIDEAEIAARITTVVEPNNPAFHELLAEVIGRRGSSADVMLTERRAEEIALHDPELRRLADSPAPDGRAEDEELPLDQDDPAGLAGAEAPASGTVEMPKARLVPELTDRLKRLGAAATRGDPLLGRLVRRAWRTHGREPTSPA